ncbi:MAG: phosphoenolpyruvate carboxykinase (ATP) [Bacteriovorax sp.]|nr:phosphoenolpyruvate carboxykinase (ATP) [Bacteriovorax sp.]
MNILAELVNHSNAQIDLHKSLLLEKSLLRKEGLLGPAGELVIQTGKHTGRSANDKYVVLHEMSDEKIWWENNINKMTSQAYKELSDDVIKYLNEQDEVFFTQRSIGSSSIFSLGIEFVSTQASAALFTQYMFKPFEENLHNDHYKILHAPNFKLDPKKYGTKSDTVIVTSFYDKTTIIIGTLYAGEIKKSMFSIMNYLLPDLGILPMHSGANQNSVEESFVFFGLSGTGKTTLSTDDGLQLIGDDEHGLSDQGVFNFEGGCYAKTFKLSFETEPSIYLASTQFTSYLENVKLSEDRSSIDFFDDSFTENGRSSYPLSFIENRVESGKGKIPKNIFYLSADAFGVLPPVSLLNNEQAIDFFKLGYSAKLAGTEIGIKTPIATFSPCFGAPFMLRHPEVYSDLLSNYLDKYKINVWLINTGWYGGSFGEGNRFPLKVTRSIIRQIQSNKLDKVEFSTDEIFKLQIPNFIEGIDTKLLIPQNSWKNSSDYLEIANRLAESFKTQLENLKL